ncbi:MAG: TolC family protein [Verrucomicrobia bacterium]|nr:TolC family protein [Verrucomicrobiota bacterium]
MALVGGLTSCKVGPNYQTPDAGLGPQWTEPPPPPGTPDPAATYWWRALNDPVLDGLIDRAYRNNPGLQSAGVSILQARAQLNQAIGNLFPQQQGLSGGINTYRLNPADSSLLPAGISPDLTTAQGLFSATWEIDLWGKYRRTIESDRATFAGTLASFDDVLVTLIADVASTYVNVRTLEERLRVADRNVEAQRESLRVATAQFDAGETSELDVRQASTVLLQTTAQIPRMQNSLNQARFALAVLVGEPPSQAEALVPAPGKIPEAPEGVAAGIPRDLLRRRPDVRQAGFQAASQSALIGVARASMYPALSLSGTFGFTSNNEGNNSLADLFLWQSRAAQAGASMVWPVFNYGRLVNQVRVQDAVFQQAVLNYQNTVLTAQQEVENGLSALRTEREALTNLVSAAAAARRSFDLSLIQYKGGESDYTTVLNAEQSQLSVEDAVASAQGNVVLNLIAVYRALGGGWELREGQDVISDEVKEAMAKRTNWGSLLEPQNHLPPRPVHPKEAP